MKEKLKNVTFSLPEHTIGKVRELAGQYELSMNALVNEALEIWIQQSETDALAKAMADASSDPMFMADMQNVSEDFQYADAGYSSASGSPVKKQRKTGGAR